MCRTPFSTDKEPLRCEISPANFHISLVTFNMCGPVTRVDDGKITCVCSKLKFNILFDSYNDPVKLIVKGVVLLKFKQFESTEY